MTNIQTNIGDLKNQLKQLQEVNLAQIDRIQGLLEKISNPSFEKLSYREQYELKNSLSDAGKFIRNYIRESSTKLDHTAWKIFHDCLFNSYQERALNKKVKIERFRTISAKDIPYDIFRLMMEDESIPQSEKNDLIRERGDKRYRVKEV